MDKYGRFVVQMHYHDALCLLELEVTFPFPDHPAFDLLHWMYYEPIKRGPV